METNRDDGTNPETQIIYIYVPLTRIHVQDCPSTLKHQLQTQVKFVIRSVLLMKSVPKRNMD